MLQSITIALLSILMIAFSFSFTALIYQGFFGVDYFSALHQLAIFIILGISADNIFVFSDAWRQSTSMRSIKHSLELRMAYTWVRAAKAIAITSSTTAVAFLANYFSNLMPIRSFGLYASILVPVNYLFVCLFFPAILLYHDLVIVPKYGRWSKKEEIQETEAQKQERLSKLSEEDREYDGLGPLNRFFGTTWDRFIFKFRWVIILAGLAFAAFSLNRARQISKLT